MITYETINSFIKNVKTIRIAICPILSQSIGSQKVPGSDTGPG